MCDRIILTILKMLSFVLLLDGSSGEVHVPLWVKRGTLRFPEERDTPVIMVGPGTGVAPFRSAVQERVSQGRHGKSFHCLAWLGSARLGSFPSQAKPGLVQLGSALFPFSSWLSLVRLTSLLSLA